MFLFHSMTGSKEAVNMDYVKAVRDSVIQPLKRDENDGIPAAVKVLQDYQLLREDLDSIVELCTWPGQKDPMVDIPSKVRESFCLKYISRTSRWFKVSQKW